MQAVTTKRRHQASMFTNQRSNTRTTTAIKALTKVGIIITRKAITATTTRAGMTRVNRIIALITRVEVMVVKVWATKVAKGETTMLEETDRVPNSMARAILTPREAVNGAEVKITTMEVMEAIVTIIAETITIHRVIRL
jgi:hypothetical protein